jgi:hypothetical protein
MVSNKPGERVFLEEQNGIYSLYQNNEITSFYELTTFPLDSYSNARDWINTFKRNLSLKWNMQFHRINILFNFCQNENIHSEQHTFFKWSDILGISKEQFDELFNIELTPQSTGFGLQVICSISTIEGLDDEHFSFCQEFSNDFINKKFIDKEHYDCLLNHSNKEQLYFSDTKLHHLNNLTLSSSSIENINWFYGLQFIYQKKTPIKLVAEISNHNQNLVIIPDERSSNNYITFLKGLWTSLNTTMYSYLNINEEINLLPIVDSIDNKSTDGIPFINKTDGSIINIDVNNSQQYHQTNFIYAKPGSGKSSLINCIDIDKILSKTKNGEIPYVCSVDIGPSKKGMISFLQHTLSEKNKDKIIYYKLTNEDVINPFDTELGCRYPSYFQQQFLTNFIYLLLSKDSSFDGDNIIQYLNHVIPSMYKNLSDEDSPFKYDAKIEPLVDKILKDINYPITSTTTWWNIVDALFKNNYIEEAKMAQRHANPTLVNILGMSRLEEITNIFGKVHVSLGENISNYFERVIKENLKQFPQFSKITSLNLGQARVISLDLDNVCKSTGVSSGHTSAIYYALASFALVKHSKMFLKSMEEEFETIPLIYKDYFKKEIKESSYNLASVSFDEYHRVSSFYAMNNIITTYFKESRKYYFGFTLASQSSDDYLRFYKLCNNTFVYAIDINPHYSDDFYRAIRDNTQDKQVLAHLKSKNKIKHMDILFSSETHSGRIEKIVSLKLNPFTLWTINTTSEDSYVRDSLVEKLGYINVIKRLSEKYPYGVKKYIHSIYNNDKNKDISIILNDFVKEF